MNQDTLSRMTDAQSVYSNLLNQADRLTDSLIEAIGVDNPGRISKLLDRRQKLCMDFDPATKNLAGVIQDLNSMPTTLDNQSDPAIYALTTAIEELQGRHKSLLVKQARCERLLQGKIDDCRMEITKLNHGTKIRHAYTGSQPVQHARYLDSRL